MVVCLYYPLNHTKDPYMVYKEYCLAKGFWPLSGEVKRADVRELCVLCAVSCSTPEALSPKP